MTRAPAWSIHEGDDLVGFGDVANDAFGEAGIEFVRVFRDQHLRELLLGVIEIRATGIGLPGFVQQIAEVVLPQLELFFGVPDLAVAAYDLIDVELLRVVAGRYPVE